jgi:hypothetical protein
MVLKRSEKLIAKSASKGLKIQIQILGMICFGQGFHFFQDGARRFGLPWLNGDCGGWSGHLKLETQILIGLAPMEFFFRLYKYIDIWFSRFNFNIIFFFILF